MLKFKSYELQQAWMQYALKASDLQMSSYGYTKETLEELLSKLKALREYVEYRVFYLQGMVGKYKYAVKFLYGEFYMRMLTLERVLQEFLQAIGLLNFTITELLNSDIPEKSDDSRK
jgi:hypothetical protein